MRRNRSRPTISLFAFQDIITSVSGIIIVMILLLTLELVERKPTDASDPQIESGRAMALRAEIESAQKELSRLNTESSQGDVLIQDIAASSPAELKQAILEQRAAIDRQQIELKRSIEEGMRLEASLESVAQQHDEQVVNNPLLQQLRETSEQLKRSIEAEQQDERLLYSLPLGFDKVGWLADIGDERIAVAPFGRRVKPIVFTNTNALIRRNRVSSRFLDWISKQDQEDFYVLLLVRPSGVDNFDKIQERLNTRKVSYGFDLIGEDDTVLDPEKGAAH